MINQSSSWVLIIRSLKGSFMNVCLRKKLVLVSSTCSQHVQIFLYLTLRHLSFPQDESFLTFHSSMTTHPLTLNFKERNQRKAGMESKVNEYLHSLCPFLCVQHCVSHCLEQLYLVMILNISPSHCSLLLLFFCSHQLIIVSFMRKEP